MRAGLGNSEDVEVVLGATLGDDERETGGSESETRGL